MALSATIYSFDIQLADVDRNVYESLSFRVPCQPSETEEYLLSRVLAYCVEHAEGIGMSQGIVEPDAPSVFVRSLTGDIRVWIEVGAPDAARLHKASKASPRVAVYTHRDAGRLVAQLAGEKIHQVDRLEVYGIDQALIAGLAERLERRNKWEMSVTDRHVYVTVAGATVDGPITRFSVTG